MSCVGDDWMIDDCVEGGRGVESSIKALRVDMSQLSRTGGDRKVQGRAATEDHMTLQAEWHVRRRCSAETRNGTCAERGSDQADKELRQKKASF
ncbi:hypothetical protein MRX96_040693 [Rhipicephalus microplus]